MELDILLRFAVQQGASDLHFQAGSPPMIRLAGEARFVEGPLLTHEDIAGVVSAIAPAAVAGSLDAAITQGLDFSYVVEGLARFRCSAYRTLGSPAIVIRVIRTTIPTLDELNLPAVVKDIARSERGLTLLSGTTGSGKSTTLAAMIDLINGALRNKIITIEDPIEYVHTHKKSMISQLEVGGDTPSFAQAMRQALRQDPDVILVGELRDVETLRIALQAADTGHQVFSTVHSATASQTIERIIAMFPPAEHKLLLGQLASSIEAIISQRLIPTREGNLRPAVEILRGSAVAQKLIFENRLAELGDYIATGESGMQTFDQHLAKMYRENAISGTEALRQATNPGHLSMAMRRISGMGAGHATI
ncbi:MAG TPA: PilT/PilU family type 4a pilus ATPase [Pirellulales bacterium]|jgi:twitching motility protein PilT|nr:PilT/PilU family type 4a pilus ATPase [Pirellulales bacterium]